MSHASELSADSKSATRLCAELEVSSATSRRARLLLELGDVEERAGNNAAAELDYSAAFQADPSVRESLEALFRRFKGRREHGELVENLARAASTAEEKVRAWLVQAAWLADQGDLAGARNVAEKAANEGTGPARTVAWLTLEHLAAKLGDTALRAEALGARALNAEPPSWKALLLLDVARLALAQGHTEEALGPLTDAASNGNLSAARLLEELLSANGGPSWAEALEALVSLGGRDDAPRWFSRPANLADLVLRCAYAWTSAEEPERAREVLDRFDAPSPVLDGLVDLARLRLAERASSLPRAASIAAKLLGMGGPVASALAFRVAEHAASEAHPEKALEVLAGVSGSIPVWALSFDLLATGDDLGAFARHLNAFAEHLEDDVSRARLFLASASLWARSGDGAAAKIALRHAALEGLPQATIARVGRALAATSSDPAWYEEATRRLLASGVADDERVGLGVELVRARLPRGQAEGILALDELAAIPGGAWLAYALDAFWPEWPEQRSRVALEGMAAQADPEVRRGLLLLAAMRAEHAGDHPGAGLLLERLFAADPSDPLVASYLVAFERKGNSLESAAEHALRAGKAATDPLLAAAFSLESGLLYWGLGHRDLALSAFEGALSGDKTAASVTLAWACRGVESEPLEGRRTAVERALAGGGDPSVLALERLALEVAAGQPDAALDALVSAESSSEDTDLAVASALARLVWSKGAEDQVATHAALARLAALGQQAKTLAAAEEFRLGWGDPVEQAKVWSAAGGGLIASLEWLAAALRSPAEERDAREAVGNVLEDQAREAMRVSATRLAVASLPTSTQPPLLEGTSLAVRLANLATSAPGCEATRRASALLGLGDGLDGLGADVPHEAAALAAWSLLVAGDVSAAHRTFARAVQADADDLASWEGLRTAGEMLGDRGMQAGAAEQLGARCADPARGAAFWEEAALLWFDLDEIGRAETALDASVARDASRTVAFDRLFRLVRERKQPDRLLGLIAHRLEVTDDPPEIARLFWEQARALREKGDPDGALKALENVTMLEPDHVGGLALTGEICIKQRRYDEAAHALARLSTLQSAPARARVTAGVAAVDIYENKLKDFDKALAVLVGLHQAKLTTLPVRERLVIAASRTGAWRQATEMLEVLMHERTEGEGRVEAARLAMAIYRDRLNEPQSATQAVVRLLEESSADGEALDMLLQADPQPPTRPKLLANARATILQSLTHRPVDVPAIRRLVKIARATGDDSLLHASLGVFVAVGADPKAEEQLLQLASKKPRLPKIALSDATVRQLLASGDAGPIADLFMTLAPTLAEALGPSLQACGVSRRDRIDPRAGLGLRNEIAAWSGAFGIPEFDLYVGGKDPLGVQGVPGDPPALVVGAQVSNPLSPLTRARVARELFALVRGTTIARWRDDVSIAAITVAACRIAEVLVEHPPYATLAEIERLISKAISRKTKRLLPDLCRPIVESSSDPSAWVSRALLSQNRVSVLACGDVSLVLCDVLSEPLERLGSAVRGDARAEELLRFVLSPQYIELRKSLGLEGTP